MQHCQWMHVLWVRSWLVREREAATSKQAGRKGRRRGSGARVLRGVSAITQGRGPLAIIPFAQPTNGTPLCLFPLPSLSSFASSPLSSWSSSTHGPPRPVQCVGCLQAAAGTGDLTSGTSGRPAGTAAPQLASAQIKQLLIHGRRPRHARDAHAVAYPRKTCPSHHQHTTYCTTPTIFILFFFTWRLVPPSCFFTYNKL